MRPDDIALSQIQTIGLDDVGSINFLVALHREIRDHEIPLFGEHEIAIFMRGDEDSPPAHRLFNRDGLERFPNPLSRQSLHAPELTITACCEKMTITQNGSVHDPVQMGRLSLTGALRAIDDLRRRFIFLELEQHRPVVKIGEEQVIIINHQRSRDGEAGTNLPRNAPVDFSGQGIERIGSLRMPNNQEIAAGMFDDLGRTISGLLGRNRPPDLFSSHLVKGHRGGAIATAQTD